MSALFESLFGLALLDPWLLATALLVPLAIVARRWRGPSSIRFAPGRFAAGPALPRSWRVLLLFVPRSLVALGLLFAIVALARPVEREPLPLQTEGIDILLCIDTSSSMRANDMDPRRTRLDVAKDAAVRFVEGRPDDRIGLVTFARYPDVRCPLTLDHDALAAILAAVAPVEADGPEDATGIGTAVARAAEVLRSSAAKSRVVILLTDGEENVATALTPEEIAPLHAAEFCRAAGVRVYAISAGIGNPGPRGEWVRLDTSQVRNLAEGTGGRFFEARDAGAVASVYADIGDLEKVEIEAPRFRIEDRFLPFLAAAIVLIAAGRLLEARPFEVLP